MMIEPSDEQIKAAALALWRAFDYALPTDPQALAILALRAALNINESD